MVKINNLYPYPVRSTNMNKNENTENKCTFNSDKPCDVKKAPTSLLKNSYQKIKEFFNKYFKPIDGTILYVDLMPYGVPLNKIDYEA